MKRSTIIIAVAAVVIVGITAFYLLAHKASAPAPATSNTPNTANTTEADSTSSPSQNPQTGDANTQLDKESTTSTSNQVGIQDFAFTPAAITVKKGTTVTWTNKDSVQHSIIGDTDNGPKSSLLSQGATYSFTFDTAGVYSYHCGPHPQMTGKVTVTK